MRLEKDIVPKVLPYIYYTSLGLILQLIRGMSDDIAWIVIILLNILLSGGKWIGVERCG